MQNALFLFFADTLSAIIDEEKQRGTFDYGIQDLGARGEQVELTRRHKIAFKQSDGVLAEVELCSFTVDRGISWETAMKMKQESLGSATFYRTVTNLVSMVIIEDANYNVYSPNLGLSRMSTPSGMKFLDGKTKTTQKMAQTLWNPYYEFSLTNCTHVHLRKSCRVSNCPFGKRIIPRCLLTGAVLAAWFAVEKVLKKTNNKDLPLLRVKTETLNMVGISFPPRHIDLLAAMLSNQETYKDLEDTTRRRQGSYGGREWYPHDYDREYDEEYDDDY